MDKSFLKDIIILYVEDELDVLNLTADILGRFVKKVVIAEHGLEGLTLFKQHNLEESSEGKIDIVVTDINMPKMNGLDMIEEIQKIDHTIPPVITTAHTDTDFLKRSINLNVRGYVNKPLNINQLIETIAYAAEPKYLKEQLETFNEELQHRVEEKTLELRSILDFQENMILVLDESNISTANKRFLDFFDFETIEAFEKEKRIYEYFIENNGYFSTKNDDWITEIIQKEDKNRIVQMKNQQEIEKLFRVDVRSFEYKTKHYVVSFTDITELQEYNNELQYKATHDSLTKLYNRQKFNDELNKEILRENRYRHNLAVIMFDIDDFKKVNDTFGHDVGDVVLIQVAQIAQASIRVTDVIARWGGEEFIILLPETSNDEAIVIAEHIRHNIAEYSFDKVEQSITVSLGVNGFTVDKDDKESFLKGVDIALYDAKKSGKNKVVEYEK
jgi:two-component system, cell cycle response regulator